MVLETIKTLLNGKVRLASIRRDIDGPGSQWIKRALCVLILFHRQVIVAQNRFVHRLLVSYTLIKGLKGDEIVKCMGKAFGRESGCRIIFQNPSTFLCNDKYIISEAIYNVILRALSSG